MRSISILAIGLALSGPAAAQTPPSADGAKDLAEALSAYFGKTAFEKKVVTVAPDGRGYRISFAPNAVIASFLEPGSKVDVTPYSLLAVERSDGNWDVSSSGPIAASYDVSVGGTRQTGRYDVESHAYSGVYSPKLGAFISGTGEFPGFKASNSDEGSETRSDYGRMDYTISGAEAGGALDATVKQTIASIEQTISVKENVEAGTPAVTLDMKFGENVSNSVMTGFKSRQMLDLWKFLVARADKKALEGDQEALRGLLSAALPLWTKFSVDGAIDDVRIGSPYGDITLKTLSFDGAADGISKTGAFTYGMKFEGLAANSPMIPAWAASLSPRDLDLRLKIDGLDLETPAKRAIAEFDLSKDPVLSDATGQDIAAGFAANPPRVVIEPSRIASRDLDVTLQGDFAFPGGEPEMNLTMEAAGLDTVISALQAESVKDPSVNEIVGGLALAKGFAKTLPNGHAQWIVATKADGSVILNGNQIVAPTAESGPAPTDENALPTEDPANATP